MDGLRYENIGLRCEAAFCLLKAEVCAVWRISSLQIYPLSFCMTSKCKGIRNEVPVQTVPVEIAFHSRRQILHEAKVFRNRWRRRIEDSVQDPGHGVFGFLARGIVALIRFGNPRETRGKHTQVADNLGARQKDRRRSHLLRLPKDLERQDTCAGQAIIQYLHTHPKTLVSPFREVRVGFT